MTRGRRPLPARLHLLNGNPGHRPRVIDETLDPGTAPLMPPWLRAADVAVAGYAGLTLAELREIASAEKIDGRSKMSAEQLIEAISAKRPGDRELGWQELEGMLTSMRIMTAADALALALVVDVYVHAIELRLFLLTNGDSYTTEGRYGTQIKHRPEVVDLAKLWDQAIRGLIEFGLTPTSRSKVSAAPRAPTASRFAQMQGRGRAGNTGA